MGPSPSLPRRSPKRSPERKVLHERSQSQANQEIQRAVVPETKQESHPVTPFPTKPAHVLLPSSGAGGNASSGFWGEPFAARSSQGKQSIGGRENILEISRANSVRTLGIKRSVSELRNLYESQATSRPTTSHSTKIPSRPTSGVTSPALRGQVLGDRLSGNGRFVPSEFDEIFALPSRNASFSIKKLPSEASLPPLPPSPVHPASSLVSVEDFSDVHHDAPVASSTSDPVVLDNSSSLHEGHTAASSSPNFVLLGHTSSQEFDSSASNSSPNIVSLQLSPSPSFDPISSSSINAIQSEHSSSPRSDGNPSSPNVVTHGTSSPNYYTTTEEGNSTAGSPASLRTIHRSKPVYEQPSSPIIPIPHEQFASSPTSQRKAVTFASPEYLPTASPNEPSSPPLPPRSELRAHSNLQTAIESSPGPEIQYPVVSAPRMNTWAAIQIPKRTPRSVGGNPSPITWTPHLSTVPSEWSDENQLGSFHTVDTTADTSDSGSLPATPPAAYMHDGNIFNPATSMTPETDRREAADMITDLRGPELHKKTSGFLSMFSGSSRSSSLRSIVLRRPDSNGSLNTTVRFPAWARRYYTQTPWESFSALRPGTSTSNFSQISPPGTAITPAEEQPSTSFFRSRSRTAKNPRESHSRPGVGPLVSNPSQPRLSLASDPVDPRSHWATDEQEAIQAELHDQPVGSRLASQWSPHLFPDNRAGGRSHWLAPTVDENTAPIPTWRNAHMIGFMLGFIFPISWFVAAFLPLPPRPVMREMTQNPDAGGPAQQEQMDYRTAVIDEVKHANIRWWRNLNRFMCAVGLVVIAIVVSHPSIPR